MAVGLWRPAFSLVTTSLALSLLLLNSATYVGAQQQQQKQAKTPAPTAGGKRSQLVVIDEDNWRQVLDGEWMLEFYAPWCPACKSLQSTWEQFAGWGDDLGIQIAQCDVTKSPGLSGRFLVTALPTIYHVKDGVFRQYQGNRDKDSFISFIEDKKWEKTEPVPFWQSPGSFHMTIVSEFFRFSNYLRDLHKSLVEDYGVSTWGSYALFGVTTIVVGALLGLLLVCLMDYVNPPKPMEPLVPSSSAAAASSSPSSSALKAGGGGGAGGATTSSLAASEGRREDESQNEEDDQSGSQDESQAGGTSQDGSEEEEDEEGHEDDDDEDGAGEEDGEEHSPAATATTTSSPPAEVGASGDAQQPRRRPRRAD